jgi:hypothetical protein
MHESRRYREELPLSEAAKYLLDECRMVLPGIQALFGFQLIAIFNSGFHERLSPAEQYLHLFATGLVACAIALIMTPASLHRRIGPHHVYESFLYTSSRLLVASMVPLALAISLEFYLIARIIVGGATLPFLLSAALLALFVFFWFVLPERKKE